MNKANFVLIWINDIQIEFYILLGKLYLSVGQPKSA